MRVAADDVLLVSATGALQASMRMLGLGVATDCEMDAVSGTDTVAGAAGGGGVGEGGSSLLTSNGSDGGGGGGGSDCDNAPPPRSIDDVWSPAASG